ncbi:TonB-dependent receptor [Arthrospiribacter ruber]|nr:TonB-dependent receptor [Arthrospiribacter ruber]
MKLKLLYSLLTTIVMITTVNAERSLFGFSSGGGMEGPFIYKVANGQVIGKVFDGDTGEPLIGATVRVQGLGSNHGTVTDNTGSYRLQGIPEGPQVLIFSFIGFETLTRNVEVEPNKSVTVNVRLDSGMEGMEEVTIVAFRKGQSRSINVQKEALNMKSVISYEQMERFPDLNIAESIKRVPGVVTEPARGEAESVMIRGLPSGMHTVTLNGQRMSATGDDRETDTRIIPTGMISSMEVIKSATADMDADATSGSINLITTRPVGDEVFVRGQIATGYNAMSGRPQWLSSLTYSKRVGKLDFVVSGNYQKDNRATEDIRHDWDVRDFGNGNQDVLAGLRPSLYETERIRASIGTQLDYSISERSSLYLRAVYNRFDEYELRNDARHGIDDGNFTAPGVSERARFEKVMREYNRITNLINLNFGGQNDIGKSTLDYNMGYSRGTFNVPLREYYAFRHSERPDYSYDISNRNFGEYQVTNDVNLNDPSKMGFRYYERRRDDIVDTDMFATINLRTPYNLGSGKGFFKVGAKAWRKTKDRDMLEQRWTSYSGTEPLTFENFFVPNSAGLIGGRYPIYGDIDWESGKRFFNQNESSFGLDVDRTRASSDPNNFSAVEDIYAAYAMTDLKFGNLNLNLGLRGEQVENFYSGNEVEFDSNGNYVRTIPVEADNIGYFNMFPMMNVRYEINKMTNLRFAYTETIVRPDFAALVPFRLINQDNEIITTGNPDLNPSNAQNIDVAFESYFQSVGFVSIGGFYKRFRNFIFNEVTMIQDPGSVYDGFMQVTPQNGDGASIVGVEIAWQQKLSFLPGILKDFGVYSNYTYAVSEANVSEPEFRTVTLPLQPKHIFNAALQFDKGGFSAQLSYNWRDTWLHEVGASTNLPSIEQNQEIFMDRFFQGFSQLDFNASQKITGNWNAFINLNNLTNSSHIHYFGRPIYPYRNSFHGWWGMMGLRFNL